ncbi:MAG: MFS transporter, partial [Hydrogenoanaerobacterium sp.]
LLHYILAMTGIDVVMGIYVFYLSDVVGIDDGILLTLFLSIPLITATISSPFWVKLSARYSKHRMYVISVVGIVIALLSTLFIPENGYLPLFSFCVISGFFMSALQILPFAAIPDVVEVDEYKHGVRREGSYFGVVQFSYNTASGIAMAFVSLTLGVFGYVEDVSGIEFIVQPESALLAVRGVLAFLPSILFLLSACFSFQINMDREKFNNMKKEIARRRE